MHCAACGKHCRRNHRPLSLFARGCLVYAFCRFYSFFIPYENVCGTRSVKCICICEHMCADYERHGHCWICRMSMLLIQEKVSKKYIWVAKWIYIVHDWNRRIWIDTFLALENWKIFRSFFYFRIVDLVERGIIQENDLCANTCCDSIFGCLAAHSDRRNWRTVWIQLDHVSVSIKSSVHSGACVYMINLYGHYSIANFYRNICIIWWVRLVGDATSTGTARY